MWTSMYLSQVRPVRTLGIFISLKLMLGSLLLKKEISVDAGCQVDIN